MTELICKTCGSNGIEKKGDIYECGFCGTKYSSSEAEQLSVHVVVKNDNSEKIEALLRAGKKSRDMENWEAASKYYEEILGLDPERWEAVYYSAFCNARNCRIAGIASAARLVEKSLKPTYNLIKENVPTEKQQAAVKEVCKNTIEITELMYQNANHHYYSTQGAPKNELMDRWEATRDAARANGMLIEEIFGSKYSKIITSALIHAVAIFDTEGNASSGVFDDVIDLLKKYDNDYVETRNARLASEEKATNASFKKGGITCIIIGIIAFIIGLIVSGLFFKIFLIGAGIVFLLTGIMLAWASKG